MHGLYNVIRFVMQNSVNEAIDKKIDYIVNKNNIYHSGKVTRINNFIVEVTGLEDAFYFENGSKVNDLQHVYEEIRIWKSLLT